MKSILISGISGVGKSTIGQYLSEDTGLKFYEYSDFLIKFLHIKDRSHIMRIPLSRLRSAYTYCDKAIQKLLTTEEKCKYGFLSIHLLNYKDGQLILFKDQHYINLNIGAILFIKAKPFVVMKRRLKDRSRSRSIDILTTIRKQQTKSLKIAQYLSKSLEVPLLLFDNSNEKNDFSAIIKWLYSIES